VEGSSTNAHATFVQQQQLVQLRLSDCLFPFSVRNSRLDCVRSFSYGADMPRKLDIGEKLTQLRAFFRQEGRAPSYAEMATLFGYASKNAVYGPVNRLIDLGYLRRGSGGRLAFTSRITAAIPALGSE